MKKRGRQARGQVETSVARRGDEQGDKWDSVKPLGQECLSREQAKRQAETSVKAYPEPAETSGDK